MTAPMNWQQNIIIHQFSNMNVGTKVDGIGFEVLMFLCLNYALMSNTKALKTLS
jgi:hypothetical protein